MKNKDRGSNMNPIEHRLSCHRCGNIRKNKTECANCPQVFCAVCSTKMITMDGRNAFQDGCPVCKHLCCCTTKSITCNRQYHCYKKCLLFKSSRNTAKNNKLHESDYTSGSVTESSAKLLPAAYQRNQLDIAVLNHKSALLTPAETATRKRKRFIAARPEIVQSTLTNSQSQGTHTEDAEHMNSILSPTSFTPVNNVFFLQTAIPIIGTLPSIEPLLKIPRPLNYGDFSLLQDRRNNNGSNNNGSKLVGFPSHDQKNIQYLTPFTSIKTSSTIVTPASEFALLNDVFYLTPDPKSMHSKESDGMSDTFTKSLLGFDDTEDSSGVSSSNESMNLNQLFETNTMTMKSLYSGEFSTPLKENLVTGDEDGFSFHGSDILVSPIGSMGNKTLIPSKWASHCVDLNGILYSPVGYIDYNNSPNANLRELSSLFACETNNTATSLLSGAKVVADDRLCSLDI